MAADAPPVPGYSASKDATFRDRPTIRRDHLDGPRPVQQNQDVSSLSSVVLDATDFVQPGDLGNPLAVPTQFSVPALNPATADNISNYSLYNSGVNGVLGAAGQIDESSFITSANFVAGPARTSPTAPFTGTVDLTFAPGLPAGSYVLVAKSPCKLPDRADRRRGQPLYAAAADGNPVPTSFSLAFNLQSSPVYITH